MVVGRAMQCHGVKITSFKYIIQIFFARFGGEWIKQKQQRRFLISDPCFNSSIPHRINSSTQHDATIQSEEMDFIHQVTRLNQPTN